MPTQLRALILEDSRSDALLLIRELKRSEYEVEYSIVDNEQDMRAALSEASWDIVLSDFSMPNFSATAGLKLVQSLNIDIPFIIVSGTMGEEAAVSAMKAGAQDYFPKGRVTRLGSAIERELKEAESRRQFKKTQKELIQAEQRFIKAFQVNPIGITINNQEGYFLSANDAFRMMLQLQSTTIIGRTASELGIQVKTYDQSPIDVILTQDQSVRDIELTLQTANKERKYVQISTEKIDLDNEVCILAMWQDITDRKYAEQALEHKTQLIQLLQTITVAANKASDVNEVFHFALAQICQFAGWPLAHIYIRTRDKIPQLTSSLVWYDEDPDQFREFREISEQLQYSKSTNGFIYHVFATGKPEWILDKNLSNFIRAEQAHKIGITSVYAFPIPTHDEIVAVMEFFSTTTGIDYSLLETIPNIALQIGNVVERTQANEELRALYNATSYLFNANSLQELAQQIVRGIVDAFQYVDCGLLLINKQTGKLNRVARTGEYIVDTNTTLTLDGTGLVPKAIRTKSIIYAPNVLLDSDYVETISTTRSELVVPLSSHNNIIGVLDLQSKEVDSFSISDQKILLVFSERAASAIEVMRLYEEVQRHATQLELRVAERTKELQGAKDRVEAIFYNSSDAIILTTSEGNIQQTNPRFDELLGYAPDELFEQHLSCIFSSDFADELTTIINNLKAKKEYVRVEFNVRKNDNSTFPADVALTTFTDNRELAIICSLRDITKQKQLEDELRIALQQQKELNELKTLFISTVSHEFKTPLAVILSSAQILEYYWERISEEKRFNNLQKIQSQVERLTALLDDTLTITKDDTVGLDINATWFDLRVLCKELIEDAQMTSVNNVQIAFSCSSIDTHVMMDKNLIQHAVVNLLSNAVKYSPEGGIVKFDLVYKKDTVTLRIQDEGVGIPEKDQAHLFENFHRASNVGNIAGTGLGLVIVHRAIKAHGGSIDFESKENVGTTFIITVPIVIQQN